MAGKTDKRRPCLVPKKVYEKNHDGINWKSKRSANGKRNKKADK